MNVASCPSCSRQIKFNPQHAGKQVSCPACQALMILPPAINQPFPSSLPVQQIHSTANQPTQATPQSTTPLQAYPADPLHPVNQQPLAPTSAAYPQNYPAGYQPKPNSKKTKGNPIVLWSSIGGGILIVVVIILIVAVGGGRESENSASTSSNSDDWQNNSRDGQTVATGTSTSGTNLLVKDDFEDGTIDPTWSSTMNKGLTIVESNGAVKIGGIVPRHPERYVNAIMDLNANYPAKSFTAEIDVLATSGTFEKALHRSRGFSFFAVGTKKRNVGLQYWANQYKIAYDLGNGQKRKYSPSNGDEMTKWYRWRIKYDARNKSASVFVNDRQIGETVAIDLGDSVTFRIRVTCIPNTQIEGSFDNFRVTSDSAENSPPNTSLKSPATGGETPSKILDGSIPIPDYLIESKNKMTEAEKEQMYPDVLREFSIAILYVFECQNKSIKEVRDWFKEHASERNWKFHAETDLSDLDGTWDIQFAIPKPDQLLSIVLVTTQPNRLRVLIAHITKR